ncbi:pyridoxine/pyridoxamine 5'-phosphate oxidase [Kitasatospora cheerisanensis]|uniref:Pyridoxal 5'-phosphate synthase n=2 Tax=Kitasatospora TaxID=2063 RepID=A0A066YL57_9ACTN|nr:pyridoxal 5'-phosphate synthase [Kitasatospora cheerisanensis]AGZ94249.1 pyridoxal 5'-phosphate synthase [Kitasatospora sp. NRRL F-6133]KDN81907.1 pyridoxal 5'-phosphate synthase [Kitasatospora cheerisanensis KCTC 2395]
MTDIRQYLRSLPVFAGELPVFEPDSAPERPETLFVDWLTEAVEAGVREPHAMVLSTAGADGVPSSRALLLKNVDSGGWQFAANSSSPKGRELAENPVAALSFYWPQQARQIRVTGPVEPESAENSAADFLARSPGSRAEAVAGRQSSPLDDRRELDLATEQALDRVTREPGLVVPEWTLYTVRAERVEFWQADKQRKHTRLRYERHGDGWTRGRLWP